MSEQYEYMTPITTITPVQAILAYYPQELSAGYTYLTQNYGERWYQKVDLASLDVNSATFCPIGQVDPSHNFFFVFERRDGTTDWAEAGRLGFAETCVHSASDLTNDWTELIGDLSHLREREEGDEEGQCI